MDHAASPAPTAVKAPKPAPLRGFKSAFSVPNVLTYGRIAAVPIMVACLYFFTGPLARWLALGVFTIACLTDWLDGYLARLYDQQSPLGRMLDPIADKLLVGAALMMLVHDDTISGLSIFAAIIILSREILVSGLREYLAELKVRMPVTWLAKWKTGIQMLALGVLIAGPALEPRLPGTLGAGLILLWLAALLTLWTGYDYLKAGLTQALKD